MSVFCSLLSFWNPYWRGLSKLYRGLQLSLRRLGEKVLEDETEGLGEVMLSASRGCVLESLQ